jgi:hypothetical protein
MMKRPVWLMAGMAIGVGGTLWAEQRVRRTIRQTAERLTPHHAASEARDRATAAGERLRSAVVEARRTRAEREAELWADLDAGPRGRSYRQ